MVSIGGMSGAQWVGKDMEEGGRGVISEFVWVD
jgi:hypothetical protein